MNETEVSLILEFGSDAATQSGAKLEIDSEVHESTSFPAGFTEPIYVLLYLPYGFTLDRMLCSSGYITEIGGVIREKEEQIELSVTGDNRSKQLGYVPASQPNLLWFGNQPNTNHSDGVITVKDDFGLPAIGWATYDVAFRRFKLIPPSNTQMVGDKPYLITIRAVII